MVGISLPDSSELTKEDFLRCGWKEVIGGDDVTYLSDLWQKFQHASLKASETGDKAEAKVLLLLGNACSMTLSSPESLNQPFTPRWVWNGTTSPTPESFTENDINFLSEILNDVDFPILKGRLSDLVWIGKVPRDVRFALEAIDSYCSLNLNKETWVTEISNCWKRALVLALRLKTAAGTRIKDLESELKDKLNQATKEDQFFGHWLGITLREFGLGKNDEEAIANKLTSLAKDFEEDGNFLAARELFKLAGKWFSDANQFPKQWDVKVAEAEGWVEEAKARMSGQSPSASVATEFYENAIQAYREIPKIERGPLHVDSRIEELEQIREDARQQALSEMKTVSTPGIDVSDAVERSRKAVRGKNPLEALGSFASIHPFVDVTELRKSAQQNLKDHPFLALIAWTTLTEDGRVAAKRPGVSDPANPDQDEPAVWSQMIHDYGIRIGMVVQAVILPALEVLQLEHRYRESDFVRLADSSPIVPPGREELFGKALFKGFDYDFVSALHLLTPQVEHMVRYRLKQAGVATTSIDSNGIEDEKSLNRLVKSPEFEQCFGEDVAFEIKALFCGHSGPNLRNNVAHGLITQQECNSTYSVYAWWITLTVVFNTYYNCYLRYVQAQDTSGNTPNGQAGPKMAPEHR